MNLTTISRKSIIRALAEIKPNYRRNSSIPIFNYLLIRCENGQGIFAYVDFDKEVGMFVKSIFFEYSGADLYCTIRPTLLRDITKLSTERIDLFVGCAYGKDTIEITADSCRYELDMLVNPEDFPSFIPGSLVPVIPPPLPPPPLPLPKKSLLQRILEKFKKRK
jgi:DNA polymerase III sliding clamp (beta) subunit (PCNA family)